jgi:hypothetical protein
VLAGCVALAVAVSGALVFAGLSSDIEAQAERAREDHVDLLGYRDGLAPARDGLQWGFVDRDYRFAIAPRYTCTRRFSEGLAAVCVGKRWGYIDRDEHFVIPPRYVIANGFREGRARVALVDGSIGEIDRAGQIREIVDEPPLVLASVEE